MKSYVCWIWVKNDDYLQKIYKEMGRKDTARLRYWLEIIFKLPQSPIVFNFSKRMNEMKYSRIFTHIKRLP